MNYNTDPLIMSGYQDRIRQLEDERAAIVRQYQEISQRQVQQPISPIWDEIDSIVAGLSDSELAYLNNNKEYSRSSAEIQTILQREYLNIMRPLVERTEDGKTALEAHLKLLKSLRKSAKDAVNQRYSMLEDYMANHSDIPFAEYLKSKTRQEEES